MTLKQHALRPVSPFRLALALATTSLLLAGCGDGNSGSDAGDDHDHDHEEVGTSGRLATFDVTTSELKILEAEDGSLLETFPLIGPPARAQRRPSLCGNHPAGQRPGVLPGQRPVCGGPR